MSFLDGQEMYEPFSKHCIVVLAQRITAAMKVNPVKDKSKIILQRIAKNFCASKFESYKLDNKKMANHILAGNDGHSVLTKRVLTDFRILMYFMVLHTVHWPFSI